MQIFSFGSRDISLLTGDQTRVMTLLELVCQDMDYYDLPGVNVRNKNEMFVQSVHKKIYSFVSEE